MGQKSRINKFIAAAGICSRRAAETLITEGRVRVNGETLTELGLTVDHDLDTVEVDGKSITPESVKEYILLNKPALTITTVTDTHGRPTVMKFLTNPPQGEVSPGRVYPVGRLDFDTEGALLLTNDGELAHKLTHPRYQVEKVYEALVVGQFNVSHAKKIANGIELEDGHTGRAQARKLKNEGGKSVVELILTEGHKHEVKELLSACGLKTVRLKRTLFGGLSVDNLKPGQWRRLTKNEISALRKLVAS